MLQSVKTWFPYNYSTLSKKFIKFDLINKTTQMTYIVCFQNILPHVRVL